MRGLTPKVPEAPRFFDFPEEQTALGYRGAVFGSGTRYIVPSLGDLRVSLRLWV